MRKWLRKLCGIRERTGGQTATEYAIIVALVAVASIVVITLFSKQLRAFFGFATQQMAGQEDAEMQDFSGEVTDEVIDRGIGD